MEALIIMLVRCFADFNTFIQIAYQFGTELPRYWVGIIRKWYGIVSELVQYWYGVVPNWYQLGTELVPAWYQLGTNLVPSLASTWDQLGTQLGINL